ncbi:AP-4 complex accessory subunit tepsin-like isoform X2 [Uloborus diversus]|uniref:AP-4 complex accessory subunit tepsin-like isoform X2 n=1 Tax=Uloborus diversus TaxID=327109 RepID=UPI00240945DF|nr:AP-4 complex accessory subunit tepsin-like isoform X2 [Uloborus diversus]
MAFKTFFNELEFLSQYPMVGAAISDNSPVVPGYLFGEINAITYVDNGRNCKILTSFLVSKLQLNTPLTSVKVLKILLWLVNNGHKEMIDEVKFQEIPLKQAMYDLHGSTAYEEIRKLAKELLDTVFSEKPPSSDNLSELAVMPLSGYGSQANTTKMSGFGYSVKTQKSVSEKVTDGITTFVEKLLPTSEKESQPNQSSFLSDSLPQYKPLKIEKSDLELAPPVEDSYIPKLATAQPRAERKIKRIHRPGRAGGGWDDSDDEDTDAASAAVSEEISKENSIPAEVVEPSKLDLQVSDWSDEYKVVEEFLVDEPLCKLEYSKILSSCKKCSSLNCEKILSFIMKKLVLKEENLRLRALVFIEYLLFHDIIASESLTKLVIPTLKTICESEPPSKDAVTLKAKKICLTVANLNKVYQQQQQLPKQCTETEIKCNS